MVQSYPDFHKEVQELMGSFSDESPDTMQGFMKLHRAASAEGALSKKVKELIALSIAICVHCDGCIAYHIHDALEAGASGDEITDAIGVAIMMGGGPSVVYGSQAFKALRQFQEEREG